MRMLAEPAGERFEHLRQGLGAVDEAERAARLEQTRSRAAPGGKRSGVGHVRAAPAVVGRCPHPALRVEGRVHQHPVGASCRARRALRAPPGAPSHPLRSCGRGRRSRYSPVFEAPRAHRATSAGSRSMPVTARPAARAAIEKATVPTPAPRSMAWPLALGGHQRLQQRRVEPGAMALRRLHERDEPAEEGVDRMVSWTAACGAVTKARSPARHRQDAAGALVLMARDQHAARQDAERAFHDAHVLVHGGMLDAGLLQERFGEGDEHGVVAAQELDHRRKPSAFLRVRAKCGLARAPIVPSCHFLRRVPRSMLLAKRSSVVGVVLSFEESQAERASISPLVEVTAAGHGAGQPAHRRANQLRRRADPGGGALSDRFRRQAAAPDGDDRLGAGLRLSRRCADVKLAASVEFMHTATLFHDDVVDESDTRRGKRTARLVWGNQESVLVGDFLLGQAFQDDGGGRLARGARGALRRRGDDRRGRGDAAHHRQEHRDDRGRVSRRDSRQDGGAVLRRGGGRRDRRRRGAERARGLPLLRRQSRHRLPARSTTRSIMAARPRRSARTSATISARAR